MKNELEEAARLVAADMAARPPTGRDGIWRFDKLLDKFFSGRSKEDWLKLYSEALVLNAGRETWDRTGYGIVASYAQTRAAYATPGFAEARSKYMT